MDESIEAARQLKALANKVGHDLFGLVVKVRERLQKAKVSEDCIATIIESALVDVLGSHFSWVACMCLGGATDERQNEIAQDIETKIQAILRDEHIKYGAKIISLDLNPPEDPHG